MTPAGFDPVDMTVWLERVRSPLGTLLLAGHGTVMCALDFDDCEPRMHRLLAARYGAVTIEAAAGPSRTAAMLGAYFDGHLSALDAVEVEAGGTPFQRRVWAELRRIPPGTTATYGQLAAALGQPGASRAVGLANSRNPVAIVVPCHRVIGADGTLTGFAGGLDRKRWLLAHERAAAAPDLFTEAGSRDPSLAGRLSAHPAPPSS